MVPSSLHRSATVSRRSFLKTAGAVACGTALLRGAEPRPLMAYVGTYSSPTPYIPDLPGWPPGQVALPPGNGKGIHLFLVDRATGALTACGVHEQTTSPTCVTINAAGTRLYSANATDLMGAGSSGSVSAFAIDRATGQLTLLNTARSEGAGPTFVSVHPRAPYLLVANYFGGSIAVLPIKEDGSLGAATDVHRGAGKVGPKKATNAPPGSFGISGHELPHAHMIQVDPAGRFVWSVDLGLDQLQVWKFDARAGLLTPNDPAFVSFPPGDGPRHFAFHPNNQWCYSVQEEGSNVVSFTYDGEKGRLTPRQTLSTLPPGYAGTNMASEILLSPDARYLYVSNRLHDSIACFKIGGAGELTYLGEEWTHGDFPRTFQFNAAGDLLYSCNQRADGIAQFRVNRETGALSFTGQMTPVGNPGIIVFLDLEKVG